ncbi:MAG: hypothetical protein ALECFALPRED_003473 [Alectoria fallacina]|uniref:O-methyltransferase C-terminal domain-containing protein n=1 Tax=Alectoria fallacina TaxID=1903189 RepID=A0A8H3IPD4_9LECA|nr:MAG: hypothetical protein ALECFALPRED_003473 [Alectoria fallacina]
MSSSRITELATLVQANTAKVDQYLQENNLPFPSFDEQGPVDFKIESDEIQNARTVAMEASLELHDLLLGPSMCLRPVLNGTSLQTIYKYDIPAKVPLNGEISFPELAAKCELYEPDLRRILRFAMVYHRVFQESNVGYVAHTAASRRLVEDANAMDALGSQFDEAWQAFAHTVEAMDKFKSHDPTKTGWTVAQKTDQPMWAYYASHPSMAKRFAGAMATFADGPSISPSLLAKGYPWSSVGNGTGTIVDVGGSKGNISVALAQSVPGLRFIVQDLPGAMQGAEDTVPSEIASRIEFMEHDFFKDQSIKADAFLFRMIFHNWSDEYVIKILKATAPGLKPGGRIIVNDYLVPEPKTMSLMKERTIREMDMIMLSLFNSRDREEKEWVTLFGQADARYTNVKAWVPVGSSLAIIEATWSG